LPEPPMISSRNPAIPSCQGQRRRRMERRRIGFLIRWTATNSGGGRVGADATMERPAPREGSGNGAWTRHTEADRRWERIRRSNCASSRDETAALLGRRREETELKPSMRGPGEWVRGRTPRPSIDDGVRRRLWSLDGFPRRLIGNPCQLTAFPQSMAKCLLTDREPIRPRHLIAGHGFQEQIACRDPTDAYPLRDPPSTGQKPYR
jgi:hypothetical protein